MYAFLGCYLAIQLLLKSLPGVCVMLHHFYHVLIQVTNRDLQNFMSEQIDLHIFKAITAASCVHNIVNKRLNNYNYISALQ